MAMASLGSFILFAAFVAASYAIAASVAGARRRSSRLIDSGVGAFYLVTALMTVASAVIVHAFATGDYGIKYVQHYSDSAQPLVLQVRVVLGRARRVDHVLGLAAGGLRHRRRRTGTASGIALLIPWVVAVISAWRCSSSS